MTFHVCSLGVGASSCHDWKQVECMNDLVSTVDLHYIVVMKLTKFISIIIEITLQLISSKPIKFEVYRSSTYIKFKASL